MPQHASPKKSIRQDKKRRMRNRSAKTYLKTTLKELERVMGNSDIEATKQVFKTTIRMHDKAANKKIISKNKSARIKSLLSKKLNAKFSQKKEEITN